jgi:CheY-like chemotaxis protein
MSEAQKIIEVGLGSAAQTEPVERVKGKCLLIDDYPAVVKSIGHFFEESDNFSAVECHSVDEAMMAIRAHLPRVIFLDHSLTHGGAEGLEIADLVRRQYPEIKIYSTTTNGGVFKDYEKRGIEHLNKADVKSMQAIIDSV